MMVTRVLFALYSKAFVGIYMEVSVETVTSEEIGIRILAILVVSEIADGNKPTCLSLDISGFKRRSDGHRL